MIGRKPYVAKYSGRGEAFAEHVLRTAADFSNVARGSSAPLLFSRFAPPVSAMGEILESLLPIRGVCNLRLFDCGVLLATTAVAWCGCSSPPREDPFAQRADPHATPRYAAAPTSSQPQAPEPPAGTNQAWTPPPSVANGPSAAEAEALAAVVAEFGNLDEQAKAQLVADLRQTDPRLWPQLLDSFRAAVQFQRRGSGGNSSPARHDLVMQPGDQLTGQRSDLAEHTFHPAEQHVDESPSEPRRDNPVRRTSYSSDNARTNLLDSVSGDSIHGNRRRVNLAAFQRETTTWRRQLENVISQLESPAPDDSATTDVAREVHLRLLYLAAGRREDALQKISGIPPEQQEFWAAELYAIGTWLDTERLSIEQQRADEALVHFDHARTQLAAIAALRVSNLHFCTAVSSYGIFDQFEANEFRPNQEVILYAEIENFMSRHEADKGYHTAIQGQYQIFDSRGQRAHEHKFTLMKEHCHNPRRDYFVAYRVQIPQWLYAGEYTLQLTIEDTLARKIGQSTIRFTVKR